MRTSGLVRCAALAALIAAGGPASAQDAIMEMHNRGPEGRFVYTPSMVRIQPGDSVRLVAADKGHNAVSIDGLLPKAAEPIRVGFNRDATITLTEPGIYGIKCTPHVALGMVGLIVVGRPDNIDEALAAIETLPARGRQRLEELLSRLTSGPDVDQS